MKKLLSIVLAVVMLATFVVSASAAETNLLVNVASNNGEKSTVTQSGNSYVIEVNSPVDAQNNGFGAEIVPKLANVNVDKDNGGAGFIHMNIVAEVPFRLTMNDANNGAWISFAGEFFNAMTPEGFAFANPDAPKKDELITKDEFFPKGTYKCAVYLGGVYTWKAKEDASKWDASKANLNAFYIEALEPGKITINQFTLSDAAEYSDATGDAPSGDNGGSTGGNSNTDTGATTTTAAKATTTTVKKPANTTGDSAKTGDVSNAIVFVVVAAAAAGVVTMSAVSKKSKAR